jgi:hypothetical protein
VGHTEEHMLKQWDEGDIEGTERNMREEMRRKRQMRKEGDRRWWGGGGGATKEKTNRPRIDET